MISIFKDFEQAFVSKTADISNLHVRAGRFGLSTIDLFRLYIWFSHFLSHDLVVFVLR